MRKISILFVGAIVFSTLVASAAAPALALGGCAVGPNYRRPKVDVPAQLRDAPATPDH